MQLFAAQVQPSATLLQPSGGVEGCSGTPITARVLTWCNPLQPFFTSISTQKKRGSGRGRRKHEGVNRETGLQRVAGLQQLVVFDAGAPPTRRSKESENPLGAENYARHVRAQGKQPATLLACNILVRDVAATPPPQKPAETDTKSAGITAQTARLRAVKAVPGFVGGSVGVSSIDRGPTP